MTMKEKRATTLAARTFRTIMAIAAAFDLETMQLDAVNAFLNSKLDEIIYLECPPGFKKEGKVWLLARALYGPRRSPLLWQKELTKTLLEFDLKQVSEDPCLFASEKLIIIFSVDDVIVLYCKENEAMAFEFRVALKSRYELREMGEAKWVLGVRIVRKRDERNFDLAMSGLIYRQNRPSISSRVHEIANDTYGRGNSRIDPKP